MKETTCKLVLRSPRRNPSIDQLRAASYRALARFGWASSGLRLGRLAAVLACAAMAQPAAANPFDAAVLRDTRASFIDVASRTRLLQRAGATHCSPPVFRK